VTQQRHSEATLVTMDESDSRRARIGYNTAIAVALVAVAALWLAPMIAAVFEAIDLSEIDHLYLVVGSFVAFDAVIPVFPSESLLTTASNLAAQSGSDIELWQLVLAGSLGAVIGDSLLYWLSRTVLRTVMSERVGRARQNLKVDRTLRVAHDAAGMLIVFGRFVPGLRFAIGATMGLTMYPYRRFLAFSAIGGCFWAAYTCVLSYLVASVIQGKPLLSVAASIVATSAILGFLYGPLKRAIEGSAVADASLPLADAG
jgi:membrane protein DedA with SNARE-associated domain